MVPKWLSSPPIKCQVPPCKVPSPSQKYRTVLNQCKKYLKINVFFFKVVKTNTAKKRLEKPKK